MDIVYADENMKDLGILSEYSLDLAYGKDENDFEITMPLSKNVLKVGYHIYHKDDANIGGIIHAIEVDTKASEIKYIGRTWHGILSEKIIEPESGHDYRTFSGDANDVISAILSATGLTRRYNSIFVSNGDPSGITINNYQVRYGDVYTVLLDMLSSVGAKLRLRMSSSDNYVVVDAVPFINYATDEEWSSSQRDFVSKRDYLPVNHMVCLGSGELKNRYVIHLFSDGGNILRYVKRALIYNRNTGQRLPEYDSYLIDTFPSVNDFPTASASVEWKLCALYNGDVYVCQEESEGVFGWFIDYTFIAKADPNAYKDSDYVLNKDAQQFFGDNERTVVFDYPNAKTTDNYKKLTHVPDDWNTNYQRYYKPSRNCKLYDANTMKEVTDVKPIAVCPFTDEFPAPSYDVYGEIAVNYYRTPVYSEDSVYRCMLNNGSYYWGVITDYAAKVDDETTYKNVEPIEYAYYRELTEQPTDWETNPEKYYWADYAMGQIVGYYSVDTISADKYILTISSTDWGNKYSSCYYKDASGVYHPVEAVNVHRWDEYNISNITDWSENYGDYNIRTWDGVSWIYNPVQGVESEFYVPQESKPTDWAKNYSSYYERTTDGYIHVRGVKKKINKQTKTVAPTWYKNRYYTRSTKTVAPPTSNYSNVILYKEYSSQEAPTWQANTYYEKTTAPVAPAFQGGIYERVEAERAPTFGNGYYERYQDHYADLIANATKKFTEYLNCDTITISLNPSEIYDIGDIVGAKDEITGLSVWQPITKKIIKVQKDRKSVDYKIGG